MPEVRDDAQSLMVAVRVRPVNDNEVEAGCTEITHVIDETMVVLMDPTEDQDDILRANRSREKQYVFDMTLGPKSTQAEVYDKTARAVIDSVLDGFNATVFAYGPTGTGKTYTMLGTDKEPGIMVRTLNDLFKAMEQNSEDLKYTVTMSYLEIYNEMIRDLLKPSAGYLDLREDSKGVVVAGLSEAEAKTTQEVMFMLTMGNKQRTCEPTAVNKTSSRSHAVLQVTIKQSSKVRNILEEFTVGKLFMIDLAGSERASQTQNRGKRLIEGAHINRSLLALGNCINALSEKGIKGSHSYVNYRDSKLTRLLKDSLGGNCKTVMIAHISPASMCFEESRNTLNYADRAKNIKMKVKRNHYNVNYHIAQYQSIIAELRQEILRLKTKMAEREFVPNGGQTSNITNSCKEKKELDKLRGDLVSSFQEQMEIRRELIDLEDTAMRMSVDYQRHILVIDEWDQEKAKRVARKEIEKRKKQSNEQHIDIKPLIAAQIRHRDIVDIHDKDTDTEKESLGDADSEWEPADVTIAKEELQNIVLMEKDINDRKSELQAKLNSLKKQRAMLEDSLPRKISCDEHREVLKLLCSVHELELKNAELESMSMLRDHLMQQKDLTLQKQELKQKLMDEIILLQRALLEDHDLDCPADLEALYQLYLLQINDSDLATPFGSTANLNASLQPPVHLTVVTPGLEGKGASSSMAKSMPTLSTVAEDGSFASRRSKKRWTDNFSDMESEDRRDTRMRLPSRDTVQAPVFVRNESSGTLEEDSVSELVTLSDAGMSLPRKTKMKRKRVKRKTKLHNDNASDIGIHTHPPTVKQTKSDSKLYKDIIIAKKERNIVVRGSHSMNDLSIIDDGSKINTYGYDVKEPIVKPPFRQRSSSLDAGREKLRLKQQFREEKRKATRPKPFTKNGSDSRIPVGKLLRKSQNDSKMKFNIPYSDRDGDLKVLATSQTPPMLVHQSGTPQGKGHKIQKSYRTPQNDSKGSNNTGGGARHRAPRVPKSVFGDSLAVSGTSMIPKQSKPGIKRF